MNTKKICSGCQKPLEANTPDGLCPECLLKAGLGTGVDLGPDSQAESGRTSFVAPSLEEVARLFPQLEILGFIGQGGMGAVYKARQKALDRVVALKILPPGIGKDAAFAERFTREAKALAKLNHTGIVTLYEFGQADGLFFFLMEFVDGMNLRHLMEVERISAREALAIVPQICDALQYAHDQGIVHRDIKPENILLDRQGRVKVADFGLAKLVGTEALTPALSHPMGEGGASAPGEGTPSPAALTDAGKVMGTPQYMAPEQREHPTEVDHRADIYSLGVVFYQMLTGELPGKPIEAPSRKVQVDVRLDEIVLRALEKEPARRYQQVSQVKTAVETISMEIEKSEVSSQKSESEPDVAQPARKWPLPLVGLRNGQRVIHWPGLLVFAGLIVAVAGGLSLFFYWLLPVKSSLGLVTGLLTGSILLGLKLKQAWITPVERLPQLDTAGAPTRPQEPPIFSSRSAKFSLAITVLGALLVLGAIANFNFVLGVEKTAMLISGAIVLAAGCVGLALTTLLPLEGSGPTRKARWPWAVGIGAAGLLIPIVLITGWFLSGYFSRAVPRSLPEQPSSRQVGFEETLWNPGFEAGLESWDWPSAFWKISTTTDKSHSGQEAAIVSDRTEAWHGIGQSILGRIEPGRVYYCSAWVRIENAPQALVTMTVSKVDESKNGVIRHRFVGSRTVVENEWTEIHGTYVLDDTAGVIKSLFFSIAGPPASVNLLVDDVSVKAMPDPVRPQDGHLKIQKTDDGKIEKWEAAGMVSGGGTSVTSAEGNVSRTFALRHRLASEMANVLGQILLGRVGMEARPAPDNMQLTVTAPSDVLNRVSTFVAVTDWPKRIAQGKDYYYPREDAEQAGRSFFYACSIEDIEGVTRMLAPGVLAELKGTNLTAQGLVGAEKDAELVRQLRGKWEGKEAAVRKVVQAWNRFPLWALQLGRIELSRGFGPSYFASAAFEGAPVESAELRFIPERRLTDTKNDTGPEGPLLIDTLPPWFADRQNKPVELPAARLRELQLKENEGSLPTAEAETKRKLTQAKMEYLKYLALGAVMFAEKNNGSLPKDLRESFSYPGTDAPPGFLPDLFELVCQGRMSEIKDAAQTIIIREKDPVKTWDGQWMKCYAFADRHVEVHVELAGQFEAWEKARLKSVSRTFSLRHMLASEMGNDLGKILLGRVGMEARPAPDNMQLTVTAPPDVLNRVSTFVAVTDWPKRIAQGKDYDYPREDAEQAGRSFFYACSIEDVEGVTRMLAPRVLAELKGTNLTAQGVGGEEKDEELVRQLRGKWEGKEAAVRRVVQAWNRFPLWKLEVGRIQLSRRFGPRYFASAAFEGAPVERVELSFVPDRSPKTKREPHFGPPGPLMIDTLPPWFGEKEAGVKGSQPVPDKPPAGDSEASKSVGRMIER